MLGGSMISQDAIADSLNSESCATLDHSSGSWVLIPHPEWGWFAETAWAMSDSTLYTTDDLTKLMLGPSLTLDDTLPENIELPLPLIRCLACAETFVLRKESAVRHCDKDLHRKLISMTYDLQDVLPASSAALNTGVSSTHEISSRRRSEEEVVVLKEKLERCLHRERQKTGEARKKLRIEYEAERRARFQVNVMAAQMDTLNIYEHGHEC